MIPLCDRRSACLLLQYTHLLLSELPTPPSAAKGSPSAPEFLTPLTPSLWTMVSDRNEIENDNTIPEPPTAQQLPSRTSTSTTTTITPKELARWIATETPEEFRRAVQDSGGRFLYRGEESASSKSQFCSSRPKLEVVPTDAGASFSINISFPISNSIDEASTNPVFVQTCDPPPDLLLPETYGYDPAALRYFEGLESRLSSYSYSYSATTTPTTTIASAASEAATKTSTPSSSVDAVTFATTMPIAKPSNGHIATSDASEASKWGKIVSVWPLLPTSESDARASFSYVWPRNESVFYEGSSSSSSSSSSSIGSNSGRATQLLVVNEKLEDALAATTGGREVLFATPGARSNGIGIGKNPSAAFLAIPAELDDFLRDELESIGYGLG